MPGNNGYALGIKTIVGTSSETKPIAGMKNGTVFIGSDNGDMLLYNEGNGWGKECRLCGRFGPTEVHHVFGGSYRQLSDTYGATVNLCPKCHRYIHSGKGVEDKRQLQCDVQYEVMDANDWDLNMWLQIFGKSWI